MKMNKHRKRKHSSFEDLSAEEKERIFRDIDEAPPGKLWSESKPLTAADRRRFERVKKKLGRPKVGNGARVVSVSVEKELLDSADAFAKRQGIGRSELFVCGLRLAMGLKLDF